MKRPSPPSTAAAPRPLRNRHRPGLARLALAGALVGPLTAAGSAAAAPLEVVPTRAQGMGGALRAAATGSAGPMMNPSGVSLVRSYVIEGSYQWLREEEGHVANVAIGDSTSGFGLGGGAYYTYATASPKGAGALGRHESGVSLSFPFGDKIFIGGTARYVRARDRVAVTADTTRDDGHNGFTFDAGITVRPVQILSLGFVARGLRSLGTPQTQRELSAGAAVAPLPDLLIAADVTSDDNKSTRAIFGGLEYTMIQRVTFRAGGGRDNFTERSFGTLGLSFMSEVGAIDLAGRMDLTGNGRNAYIGVSARLFVPTP